MLASVARPRARARTMPRKSPWAGIPALSMATSAPVPGDAGAGRGERGSVVDAVAGEGDAPAARLQFEMMLRDLSAGSTSACTVVMPSPRARRWPPSGRCRRSP